MNTETTVHYHVAKDINVRVRFYFSPEREIIGATYYLSIITPQELKCGMIIRLGEIPLPELRELSNTHYCVDQVTIREQYGLVYYEAEASRTISETDGSSSALYF